MPDARDRGYEHACFNHRRVAEKMPPEDIEFMIQELDKQAKVYGNRFAAGAADFYRDVRRERMLPKCQSVINAQRVTRR